MAIKLPLFIAVLLLGIPGAKFLFWRVVQIKRKRNPSRDQVQTDRKQVLEWLEKFGFDSNSFLTLYEGFEYFKPRTADISGTVAFVDASHAWVAATPPITNETNRLALLEQFKTAATEAGKSVMMLPVDESFARQARTLGFDAVMIGSEPMFELGRYVPDLSLFHSAKGLQNQGATVRCYKISDLTETHREECEEILRDWFAHRWITPLQFLNRVNPWELGNYKRYFLLHHQGKCLGFLAAVPVWAANAWYCVDLIRRADAPPGTTEMIILEAMRILKAEGAAWVSLGVSPLSRMDLAPKTEHPAVYRIFHLVFEKGNTFYRFKPLFDFKKKFSPTSYPTRYLLMYPGRTRLAALMSLLYAFVPGGMFGAVESAVVRRLRNLHLQGWLDKQLRSDLVVRCLPQTISEFCSRTLFTCSAALATVVVFLTENNHWRDAYAFSWTHLRESPLQSLLFPTFLHENFNHIALNLLLEVTGVALCEILIGTWLTASVFATAALFSNPITLFALKPFLLSELWTQLDDVGASLGIFGCWGALIYLFSNRSMLAIGISMGVSAVAVLDSNPMSINHVVAFWMGFGIVKLVFERDATLLRL